MKWYTLIVPVSMGGKKIGLCVVSKVKVFAVQSSMIDYIQPHDNQLDQEPFNAIRT